MKEILKMIGHVALMLVCFILTILLSIEAVINAQHNNIAQEIYSIIGAVVFLCLFWLFYFLAMRTMFKSLNFK